MLFIAAQTKKPRSPNSKRQNVNSDSPVTYKCTRCGKTRSDPKGYFFMSKTSPLFTSNELYTHICSDCVNELMFEMQTRYKDTKIALMITCHFLDVYFSEELYESIKDNANFSFGNYLKLLNGTQYKAKSFTTSLMNIIRDGLKGAQTIQQEKETKWSSSDLKNKNYVLQTVGYDCFEDESYTDSNRKFLFNTLADYLTDDVVEDPHKLQCVISMVKTTLQVENIDRMINAELRQINPDSILIDKLSGIKDKLSRNINTAANDNGISAKGSGKKSAGANALTNIMKEMAENGFEEIKVNIFNSKMSDAFKNISDISNKSLFEQLNYQQDDYAKMVATQRDMIQNYVNENDGLTEQVRLLKIQIKELKESLDNKTK